MNEIFLDTETTGLSFKDKHRIVEIACIETNGLIPTKIVFHKLINPERNVPEDAVKIHGFTSNFLKTSLNSIRKAKGNKELDTLSFLKLVKEKSSELGIDEKILSRQLNVGFSGGEKKKNEILQMKILNPSLSILDETDSGLDIDALKIIANGVNSSRDSKKSFLVITHYQRLLNFIKPDFVHVLSEGKIVKSGTKELAIELEKTGYKGIN